MSSVSSVIAWIRRSRWKLVGLGLALSAPFAAHLAIEVLTRIRPPPVTVPAGPPLGYTRTREGIREIYLEGGPERMGFDHARLARERMIDIERQLWDDFHRLVPMAAARALLLDLTRVRYRDLDSAFPLARRQELAAEALGLEPDPYAERLPTYHRVVFLHALYDIALSFERSPLIGCTTFGLGPGATEDGHVLAARAFDFEAGDVFDRDKAVFFMKPDGAIPFASVAWPGLIGVVTGMNLEGVAVFVHGARAGEARTTGVPVVFELREVLERARDTEEAIQVLRGMDVMVSHILFLADARGDFAIVERAPGAELTVRRGSDPDRVGLTNHLEGPLANDPKNRDVEAKTSTLDRRARVDELLAAVGPREANVERAVAMLRDHRCARGTTCAIGDRRTIDALIATHGVVVDTTDRVLWVSAGPHLSGKFVRFDLRATFAPGHDPMNDSPPLTIAEDPVLFDGRYEEGRIRAGGPRLGADRAEATSGAAR